MKPQPTLVEINTFVVVAEHLSFSEAALHLGISASTASMSIRSLESKLEKRLLNRTSRSVALTGVGARLLPHLRLMLAEYDNAIEAISESDDTPSGLIRIHVRAAIYQVTLEPLLARFLKKYPRIKVDISTDTLGGDLVSEHFDLGIAMHSNIPRDMIATRISEDLRLVLAAAPSYLAARGYPGTPHDLKDHDCIRYRTPDGKVPPAWRFGDGGEAVEVPANGPLILNHFTATIRAAVEGIGLVRSPMVFVAEHIREGRLIEILPDWTKTLGGYYVYYPSRRHMPAHMRALIDFLKSNFESETDKARLTESAIDDLMAMPLDTTVN